MITINKDTPNLVITTKKKTATYVLACYCHNDRKRTLNLEEAHSLQL